MPNSMHVPGFLASELDDSGYTTSPERSRFHVIPAPMELSVSYGSGTANGPAAILEASQQLEILDGMVPGASVPARAGIHTTPLVDCSGPAEACLDNIEAVVDKALDCKAIPVLLGGEHTVTLGGLRALAKRHGSFGIIQFDAHADLRHEYQGSTLSHACVMRRAVEDLGLELFQIGVRALSPEEAEYRDETGIGRLDARDLYFSGLPEPLLPKGFPQKVYLTFDVDGLDPSVVRATGTPVPGGLSWFQALHLAELALRGRKVLGLDVVELAPQKNDHASNFAAAQLAYCLMGLALRT